MSASDSSVNVQGTGTFPIDVSFGTDATSGVSVYRQRMVLGGDTDFSQLATVQSSSMGPTASALATRLAPGNPDLNDIKELLMLLIDATNRQFEFLSVQSYAARGRANTVSYPPRASVANVSGSIVTGGTAQLLFSAGNVRGFDLQNESASQALGFSWWTSAPVIGAANTYQLAPGSPGGYYSSPPTLGIFDQISVYVIGSTTGQAFTGCYW